MKQFKYIIVFALVTGIVSCKKEFLDVQDNSLLFRQGYVKDLNSLEEFMRGVYVELSATGERGVNAAYPGLIADELKVSSATRPLAIHNNWSQVASAATGNLSPNASTMNGAWMSVYRMIRSCNFVIEKVDEYASDNPGKASDIKGQAFAMRAFFHLRQANFFAQHYTFTPDASHTGVPYITVSDITKKYSRQSVAEVYAGIIADLETAISLFPSRISDTRYMNKSAAKALLARIYLYKEDFAKARALAIEIISQHPLMQIGDGYPVDLFKLKSPIQTEILFQATPLLSDEVFSEFLGTYFAVNYYRATSDIATILKSNTNDIRSTWVSQSGINWRVVKFPQGVAGGLGADPTTDYYVPLVRSSEMFLTAAEASAKTDDEVNARLYLNAVRKRADPALTDIAPSGGALLDSIYSERRKELCFEGFRMWDLQRWKKGVQRTDVFSGFQTTLPYPANRAIAPIPFQDVMLMGLPQNPGY